jgi:pimeloyl-ACP methyl ester carboxylesterase
MASVTHFIWPIPERGLAKRLHRIRAKTLVLWGAADKLISNIYAQDFATHIKSAHAELIPGAGHSPQFSDERAVLQTVRSFLS